MQSSVSRSGRPNCVRRAEQKKQFRSHRLVTSKLTVKGRDRVLRVGDIDDAKHHKFSNEVLDLVDIEPGCFGNER